MIRCRLAPSPTGAQHLGNARTFLIAWLSARSQKAHLILRIEDIDSPRVKIGAGEQILEDLRWLGLDWDQGPIWQTSRLPLYQAALEELKQQELVYPCTCTRTDIEQAASAPHLEHEGPVYPGICSHRHVQEAATILDRPYAWRFRVHQSPSFEDGFRGQTTIDLKQVGGDFVVWKSSSTPAYQLAVVVDDADMGITEVVRGDDLLPSTPRQMLLYQALNKPIPKFIHVPLVVGTDGRRLAKRHGDTRLATFRQQGIRPEQILGLLAWSCGWLAKPQEIGLQELLSHYQLQTIPKQPFVFQETLLLSQLE